MKKVLRFISGGMLAVAIAFLAYVFNHPEAGTAFYVCGHLIGAEIWRIFYAIYALVMVLLFAASFFVRKK